MAKYELFYASGGHGGPYPSLYAAWKKALDYLNTEEFVEIRIYDKTGVGGYSPFMRVTQKGGIERYDTKTYRLIDPVYAIYVNDKIITNETDLQDVMDQYSNIALALDTAKAEAPVVSLVKTVAPEETITLLETKIVDGKYQALRDDLIRYNDDQHNYYELPRLIESILVKHDGKSPYAVAGKVGQ